MENKHDDIMDCILYALQTDESCGKKYVINRNKDQVEKMDISGYIEKPLLNMLCEQAKTVHLLRYDGIDGTLYVARTYNANYILSKKGYEKVRRAIWNTRG